MNLKVHANATCNGCGCAPVLVVEIETEGCFEPVELCLDCVDQARVAIVFAMPEGDRP